MGANLLWWMPKLARKWISQADKVICVSRRQAEIIADQAPELRDKIEIVYNPLPPEVINAKLRKELDDTPTFLYVGGDGYIKGFHILLQALNRLGKQKVKAKFIFAGAYNQQSVRILKYINNKYDLNIQLVGKVESKKIYELHRETWALIFPSITEEPLPYAVAEAMALGTIPIASKAGGMPEITINTSAENFLFVPGNIDELINKIKMVMSQPREKIISIGIRLKEHATKLFDSKEISSKILRVFNSD
jgi:glycosyltransferase involved in cell wall biosynthesis